MSKRPLWLPRMAMHFGKVPEGFTVAEGIARREASLARAARLMRARNLREAIYRKWAAKRAAGLAKRGAA